MRKSVSVVSVLFVASFIARSGSASEEEKADSARFLLAPAVSTGFSYPMVLSVSAGLLLSYARPKHDFAAPIYPALRADVEAGLGGGSIAAGIFLPSRHGAVSLKAVRMRTWLLTWNEETNRTFDGAVVEYALPTPHGGPKLGLGSFKDREPVGGTRESFTYVFLGVGW
jgi:hypothetical protein